MVGHKFVQVVVQGIRMDKVGYKFQASLYHPELQADCGVMDSSPLNCAGYVAFPYPFGRESSKPDT